VTGPASTLVFTWGNPSRGDDALGPAFSDLISQQQLDNVEIITDFQLQIEHSLDLAGRTTVIFVDAGVATKAPFEMRKITPCKDDSFTSHALSPQALLNICEQINGTPLPECHLLTIRGYVFDLGTPLSMQASRNLQLALTHLVDGLQREKLD